MLSREEKQRLEKTFMINIVIWGAVFVSLPIYLVICQFLTFQQLFVEGQENLMDILMIAFLVVSFLELGIIVIIRRKMLKGQGFQTAATVSADIPVAWEQQAAARYSVVTVVSAALSESIGVYGLVLYLLSKNEVALYLFIFLSGAAMVSFRPKKHELMEFAQHVKGRMG